MEFRHFTGPLKETQYRGQPGEYYSVDGYPLRDGLRGVIGHVTVGNGAQIAGAAHVKDDVDACARMGGTPARPFKEWARELGALKQLGRRVRRLDG